MKRAELHDFLDWVFDVLDSAEDLYISTNKNRKQFSVRIPHPVTAPELSELAKYGAVNLEISADRDGVYVE